MAILVNKNTKVLVQGITGKEGAFHTERMVEYGTKVVGGVTPGKGGMDVKGIPVFDTVRGAVERTGADASVIFVPAALAADACLEAVAAGIKVIALITEGIPVNDMVRVKHLVDEEGVVLIGPNCPGLATVGEAKLGIMPGHIFAPGPVGLVSRSGTLTYQVVDELTRAGIGQTTCVGIGGDPIPGSSFLDILKLFNQDEKTKAVALIGEIGGTQEEEAAEFIKETGMKVVAFIAGKTAPPGKRMGHAGAIISGGKGTAQAKVEAFNSAGIPVAETTGEMVRLLAELVRVQVR
jgi:succinyl-CoA synthetase alpha subunit